MSSGQNIYIKPQIRSQVIESQGLAITAPTTVRSSAIRTSANRPSGVISQSHYVHPTTHVNTNLALPTVHRPQVYTTPKYSAVSDQ